MMNIHELIHLVNGVLLTPQSNLNREVKGAFAADLMSDVLAAIQPEAVLVTGLCNPQVIRTAQMAEVAAVILVRGKTPPAETINLANQEGIPFVSTPFGMFEVCGRLYNSGVKSLERPVDPDFCDCG
ncbi:predicted transcriptional regulator containing CBS domains [Anaerolinea thermolimosa]|uniref:DRTGG domain-containing protein n=1 Tax=Anaerolinea thermolimosa TaxID=229919 RepID=UPI000A039E66|nr:DRTGG domain-containing protein [Anaerolinea thermolimosa]GAP06571.1 predicted transcriptional regulator containing CBS domains [Anaerolinea thermolimosa]